MLNQWPQTENLITNQDERRMNGQPPLNVMGVPITPQSNKESEEANRDNERDRSKKNSGTGTSGVQLAGSKSLPKKQFCCSNCGYFSKRKHTVMVHIKQHCVSNKTSKEAIKLKSCRICGKKFTHDGLRSHLRGYIKNPNRKIRGVHKNFDVNHHNAYLDEIKFRPHMREQQI